MTDQPIRPDYESQTIRLTDHAVTDDVIVGKVYSNCHIVGPAIVVPIEGGVFGHCTFDVANNDPESILYVVTDRWLVGVIALRNCQFYGCRFTRIGFMGDERFAQFFLNAVKGL
jgi:hypothetical protein